MPSRPNVGSCFTQSLASDDLQSRPSRTLYSALTNVSSNADVPVKAEQWAWNSSELRNRDRQSSSLVPDFSCLTQESSSPALAVRPRKLLYQPATRFLHPSSERSIPSVQPARPASLCRTPFQ